MLATLRSGRLALGRTPPTLLLASALLAMHAAPALPAAPVEWSDSAPRVNATHIFQGGINRRGRPVGFHSRPGGRDPEEARVVRVLRPPNRFGVYEALVEIRDRAGGRGGWATKRSTFYPDRLDRAAVIAAILSAYGHREPGGGGRFRGSSGLGFTIEGYLLEDGSINTAYPVY